MWILTVGGIMSTEYKRDESFASLLKGYMNAADYGTTTLCKAVNAKFGPESISRSTLTGWRDRRIEKLRGFSWKPLAQVLHILRLNTSEANLVFHAAGLRPIKEMWEVYSRDKDIRLIFEPWLFDIEGDRALLEPISEAVGLSTLKPLTTEQRKQINEAIAVQTNGINMFRTMYVFQYEFRHMLSVGGEIRVLLSHPEGAATQMAALRSELQAPVGVQKKRAYDTLELLALWKHEMPDAKIQVRLLDYLPPYGITIIYPGEHTASAQSLVRLYAFRSSTSVAPAFGLSSDNTPKWFAFFSEQFEKMWGAGENYPI